MINTDYFYCKESYKQPTITPEMAVVRSFIHRTKCVFNEIPTMTVEFGFRTIALFCFIFGYITAASLTPTVPTVVQNYTIDNNRLITIDVYVRMCFMLLMFITVVVSYIAIKIYSRV